METINPRIPEVQYAVRGELALKADKYLHQLEDGQGANLPFDKIIAANIGNPQLKGLNQRPITFWRQVISLLENPALMEEHLEVTKKIYPADAIARAQSLYKEIGSVGAYTHSKGVLGIRQRVAKFIEGESVRDDPFSASYWSCPAVWNMSTTGWPAVLPAVYSFTGSSA